MTFKLLSKRFLASILLIVLFMLSACASSLSAEIKNHKWQTATDEDGACIRLEFAGNSVKYVSVMEGEDTFAQDFTYTVNGNTLVFTNDYATLTFEGSFDDEILSLKTESNETLIFNKIQ